MRKKTAAQENPTSIPSGLPNRRAARAGEQATLEASVTPKFRNGLICCRVCACTETEPCEPPCSWEEVDLCSSCDELAAAFAWWLGGAHLPNKAALMREVERIQNLETYPYPAPARKAIPTAARKRTARP